MKLKSLKSQNDITKTIRERKLRHKATWAINNGQNKVQMELAIRIFFSHAHFGFGFCKHAHGNSPEFEKKTNMCIFNVSLYFCTKNTLFCLKNGIFALEMAFMTQN